MLPRRPSTLVIASCAFTFRHFQEFFPSTSKRRILLPQVLQNGAGSLISMSLPVSRRAEDRGVDPPGITLLRVQAGVLRRQLIPVVVHLRRERRTRSPGPQRPSSAFEAAPVRLPGSLSEDDRDPDSHAFSGTTPLPTEAEHLLSLSSMIYVSSRSSSTCRPPCPGSAGSTGSCPVLLVLPGFPPVRGAACSATP